MYLFIIIASLFFYLFLGTGIHSDDYDFIMRASSNSYWQILTMEYGNCKTCLNYIPALWYDWFQMKLYGNYIFLYDVSKALTSFICFISAYKFGSNYFDYHKALFFAFLFILYPLHDATNYWFVGQYIMITGAIVMYSHYCISKGYERKGLAIGFVGAFWSYASPAYGLGLSVIFLLQKEYRKFILFLVPILLYIIYYLMLMQWLDTSEFRTADINNSVAIIKNYTIQLGTFLDAFFGPSFFLKIIYSIASISWFSFVLWAITTFFFWKTYQPNNLNTKDLKQEHKHLLIAVASVSILAFGQFSLTGLFPQITFNLGNRVTIYGSLLVTVLLVIYFGRSKKSSTLIFSVFMLAILGLSDHWKNWSLTQQTIVENIRSNKELESKQYCQPIFVANHQYSKLGDLSHIEFWASSNASQVFLYATGKVYNAKELNPHVIYKDGKLVNTKFGDSFDVVEKICVYDSETNKIFDVLEHEIPTFLAQLKPIKRHWIQLLPKDSLLNKIVLILMPRLKYVL